MKRGLRSRGARTGGRIAGLYAITPDLDDTQELVRRTAAAIAGGARVVQYRNKRAAGDLAREHALALRALTTVRGAMLIVNDDVELAQLVDADGVHVGRDDVAVSEARAAVGDAMIVGASCYDSLDRARDAVRDGADYVAFGSFFVSPVKPHAVRATPALLDHARASLDVPIVAIGGIDAVNAAELVRHGADALAVISAVFDAPDVESAARAIAACFEPRGA